MQAPLPPAVTNRKPASISMMVCRTEPRLNRRPALRARPCRPDATAESCSASSRLSPADFAISRPSSESTTAWSTRATRSTRSFTSQVVSTVMLGRCTKGSPSFIGAGEPWLGVNVDVIDDFGVYCGRFRFVGPLGHPGGFGAAAKGARSVRGHHRADLFRRARVVGVVHLRPDRALLDGNDRYHS